MPEYRSDFHGTAKDNIGDFSWGCAWVLAICFVVLVGGTLLGLWAAGMEIPLLNIHRVAVTHSLEYSQTNINNLYAEQAQVVGLESKEKADPAHAQAYQSQAQAVLLNMHHEVGTLPDGAVPDDIRTFLAQRS